jgi:prepilin peptidase CpaA
MSPTENLMAGVVLVVLAMAVREDLLRHRVPNALNLAALLVGLGLALLDAGLSGIVHSVAGTLVGSAALVPLYLLRGMGAGDVKLMGATGAFLGPSSALLAAALALIAGGVLGVAIVFWRLIEPRLRLEAAPSGEAPAAWNAAATISVVRKEQFPYAVAIAVGVVTTLWLRGSLGALFVALGIG